MNFTPVDIALAVGIAALSFEVFRLRKVSRQSVDPALVKTEVEKAAAVVVEQRIKAWEIEEGEREDATEKKLFTLLEKRIAEQRFAVLKPQGKTKDLTRPLNQ